MFNGTQINELVKIFDERNVTLYHSCQYIDFISYLQLGGIPSRRKLVKENKPFTKFETDGEDHKNDVWDKVFLNLQNFGEIFTSGNGVPNVYGPIQLYVRPAALLEAKDVAVSLKSAGSPNFNRINDSLSTLNEIQSLFRQPFCDGSHLDSEIMWLNALKSTFNLDYASYPEISLTYEQELLPLSYVKAAYFDDYVIDEIELLSHAWKYSGDKKFGFNGGITKYEGDSKIILKDLTDKLLVSNPSLDDLLKDPTITPQTQGWVSRIKAKSGMDIQWRRYARYIREGTLLPILEERKSKQPLYPAPDYRMYKCLPCDKIFFTFEQKEHIKEVHAGKSVEWKKI